VSPAGQVLLVVGVLAVLHVPLGNYLARVYTASAHGRVEMLIFRLGRIDPEADQRWPVYLTSLLAFSAVGVGALYLLLRLQGHLPYSLGHPGMSPALAFDTAVSFTTNTSWQSYSGESTLGHTALAVGLGTQAFLSLAVGMAAASRWSAASLAATPTGSATSGSTSPAAAFASRYHWRCSAGWPCSPAVSCKTWDRRTAPPGWPGSGSR